MVFLKQVLCSSIEACMNSSMWTFMFSKKVALSSVTLFLHDDVGTSGFGGFSVWFVWVSTIWFACVSTVWFVWEAISSCFKKQKDISWIRMIQLSYKHKYIPVMLIQSSNQVSRTLKSHKHNLYKFSTTWIFRSIPARKVKKYLSASKHSIEAKTESKINNSTTITISKITHQVFDQIPNRDSNKNLTISQNLLGDDSVNS